jgi:hypothetical protein
MLSRLPRERRAMQRSGVRAREKERETKREKESERDFRRRFRRRENLAMKSYASTKGKPRDEIICFDEGKTSR